MCFTSVPRWRLEALKAQSDEAFCNPSHKDCTWVRSVIETSSPLFVTPDSTENAVGAWVRAHMSSKNSVLRQFASLADIYCLYF